MTFFPILLDTFDLNWFLFNKNIGLRTKVHRKILKTSYRGTLSKNKKNAIYFLHIGQLREHISAPKTKRKNAAGLSVPESVILTFFIKSYHHIILLFAKLLVYMRTY